MEIRTNAQTIDPISYGICDKTLERQSYEMKFYSIAAFNDTLELLTQPASFNAKLKVELKYSKVILQEGICLQLGETALARQSPHLYL